MFYSNKDRYEAGLILAICLFATLIEVGQTCKLREVNGDSKKLVCVCDEQECDKFTFDWPQKTGESVLVETSELGLRFHKTKLSSASRRNLGVENSTSKNNNNETTLSSTINRVQIDLSSRYQQIIGWGGGLTDAAGINLANSSVKLADMIIDGYYGESGLQYNFGRVPIGGTDFSDRPYTYDENDGKTDYNLTNWSLAPEDSLYKIPYIRKASLANEKMGQKLKLVASPWSPPTWMKTNNNIVRGRLIDDERIYRSYAEYLMKFYDSYLEHGIKFWGGTVQNEPLMSDMNSYFFNSLQFNNENITNFIANYLGPALEARGYTKENFKLMAGDDSLGLINHQVPQILNNKEAQKYISGLAFHWYTSGIEVPYSALDEVYEAIKDKIEFVLMTEACTGFLPEQKKVDLGSWDRGEMYATDIIEDLLRHTGGWIDWNLVLDYGGGPNWSKNFVDSPVIINGRKGEFYRQPMFYTLAHFSRFFRPGTVRVGSKFETTNRSRSGKLMAVAVHNKETQHLIVNILNKSEKEEKMEIVVDNNLNLKTQATISGRSINTIVIKL